MTGLLGSLPQEQIDEMLTYDGPECLGSKPAAASAIEWTQKQIRECFSGVRKVKGKVKP